MKNIYAISDNVALTIMGGLMLFAHDAAAVRTFQDLAKADGTMVQKHLADFDLILVGTFNEDTGEIEPQSPPTTVLRGAVLADMWAAQTAEV